MPVDKSAAHFRAKADEYRKLANACEDDHSRKALLALADECEHKASNEIAERLGSRQRR
jgi:hypothetical protein